MGTGPRLHRHPYTETFVIAPAGMPHTFSVLGPGVYESVHIHESDHFVTEWLE